MSAIEGEALRLRRASEADAEFVAALVENDEVEPFLAASRPRGLDAVLDDIRASAERPDELGVFVVEVPDGD
ncbi:MAG TPA: hypothetical protein VHH55_01225, partial [Gaiellaceae bacterium]|nr:hypothetical protein [Gaiellaceae bacterium]